MSTRTHTARHALALLAAVGLASCGPASVGGPGPPARLKITSASRQTGLPGTAVASPPRVIVTDAAGTPLSGVTVSFAVTAGGGSVAPASGVSGANGAVQASWTLGAAGSQTLRASLADVPTVTATFSAEAVAGTGYHIDLRLLTSATDTQWAAFTDAAARIEQVIVNGIGPVDLTGRSCWGTSLSGTAQDLLILVRLKTIDGRGGILGQAGPCVVRGTSQLPAVGLMEFDTADLADLEASGTLRATILHEMLHVVGFGTVWNQLASGEGTAQSAFTGPAALAAAIGFNGAPGSWTSVPLENCGTLSPKPCGSGTQDSHWLEPTFKNELMTGWLSGSSQPLSRTTIGSLADLGYTVDLNVADPFDLATARLRALESTTPELGQPLGDDVLRLPIETVP